MFGVTFNRFRVPSRRGRASGNWPSALGLGNFGAGNFPLIQFQGINGTDQTYVAGLPIDETILGSQFNDFYAANTFLYNDTLSWIRGRHTYKFGAELRAQQFNSHGDNGVPTFIIRSGANCRNLRSAGWIRICQLFAGGREPGIGQRTGQYLWPAEISVAVRPGQHQGYIEIHAECWICAGISTDVITKNTATGRTSTRPRSIPSPGCRGNWSSRTAAGDSFERKQYYHNFSGHIGGAYQLTPKTVARASFGHVLRSAEPEYV